jgi:hypothetical protein
LLVSPLRASTKFYLRFTLPRRSSTGFGSYPGDSRHFHTSPLITCGHSLSLRLPLYGLVLPHRYTPWLVIQNGRRTPEGARLTIPCRFQDLFTLCEEYFSAFPHGTIRYRTRVVFTVRGCCPLNSHPISKECYSGYFYCRPRFRYGAITLYGPPFQGSSRRVTRHKKKSCNTTSPSHCWRDSVCRAPLSVALTCGIPYGFLFLPVLRCFNSRRLLTLRF